MVTCKGNGWQDCVGTAATTPAAPLPLPFAPQCHIGCRDGTPVPSASTKGNCVPDLAAATFPDNP
ncbi:MAG: hypothetical protein IJ160_09200 [Muribaculaceae bacterium]|nr:hypothetical protein [Muribaculaceae bacterium]